MVPWFSGHKLGSVAAALTLAKAVLGVSPAWVLTPIFFPWVPSAEAVGGLLELEWAVTDKWLLYLDQRWQSGDVVSTGNPTLAVINRAEVVVSDDAYGAGGFGWRLDGDSWISGLGSNWQLRPNLSVDLLFRHIDTENELDVHYRREQFFSSLLYRF